MVPSTVLSVLTLILAVSVPAAADAADAPALADTAAGRIFAAWLAVFEEGNEEALDRFIADRFSPAMLQLLPPELLLEWHRDLRLQTGGLTVHQVRRSSETAVLVLCRAGSGDWLLLSLEVAPQPPHLISNLLLEPGGDPLVLDTPPAADHIRRLLPKPPRVATVPFSLDHNRMFVPVDLLRPDGTRRTARAWVDTGNQYLILAAPLALDLGFDLSGLSEEAHAQEVPGAAPPVYLGELPLRVAGVGLRVFPGERLRGLPAEVNLPAAMLRYDHVVFDYPEQRLTIARPGVLKPQGTAVACQVNAETGLPMVTAILDGEPVALGLDNGSVGTWVSNTLTSTWQKRHPTWPRASGAAGSTNFFGFPFELQGVLMRLPELEIAGVHVHDVNLLGLDQRLFDWYSEKSAGPVLGFIGANVLRSFRLEIDFAQQMSYWQGGPPAGAGDLDIVGLTLRPEADGRFIVAGVVSRDGAPVVEGISAGDRLLRVDRLDTAGMSMGQAVEALRGTPGSIRTLVLERDGQQLTVEAPVVRLP